MTDTQTVSTWVEGYRRAWESNAEADIRALFTDDAVYRDAPWEEPRTGVDAIAANWTEHADQPGEWTFEVGPIHVDGDTAFVQAVTDYLQRGVVYDNLWIIGFAPDGRAASFTEWYMKRGS
ncbi:nuclear transport factor 2 family protein [Pseudolysinimonas sp.]|uniref:nuclear transport factor 2 family protein n=1 Tax=Pseudolysinimonas sp. TaxID=2680009 RepID=UPI003F7FF166